MKQKKIKVGIIGEDPINDSKAFCLLLQRRPYPNVQFITPVRNIRGNQLEMKEALIKRMIGEIYKEDIEYFICIRDLDDTLLNVNKLSKRDEWFSIINKGIENRGIFYLAVSEIEALMLSDIEFLKKKFKTKFPKYPNPMNIKDPKAELSLKTKGKYNSNLSCEILEKINFLSVYQNHKGERSFQEFINKLDDILK